MSKNKTSLCSDTSLENIEKDKSVFISDEIFFLVEYKHLGLVSVSGE